MGLTHAEWNKAAEKAAAEAYGRDHKNWYIARRFAPATVVTLLVLGVIAGVWWLIAKAAHWAGSAHVPSASASVPSWVWIAMAVAAVATAVAFRPRMIPSAPGILPLKVGVSLLMWVGLIGLALGYGVG